NASDDNSQVMVANYNEPSQIVISGHREACEKAVKWLNENYKEKFRAIELNVSAPFHSSLMQPAAEKLAQYLEKIEIKPLSIPYIANIDAKIYPAKTEAKTLRHNLYEQVCGSVYWTQSIQDISNDSIFIEVGPGSVLSGLIKKIKPMAKIIALDTATAYSELDHLFGANS
ncbi:MAG: ACP S-malonyltransferase, partial [Bacteriovoracaceae bacterium]|nr:ACP S-malonyltransferase [Bacteriovoracaceae bacterium]